ncbi:hypothetical protein KDA_39220 [Dictyobacter alpinus]|uniref:Peptidase C14 caspase domain-containing protein n=1 Tax=Dictyobacter alpinus TaxID=2014873 RepID=A0A402BAK8_9CHLR|nr:tetratricopeptide repeat protein [Dictyobacter alpinus]GCE28438.1 hypothetical protein KDA_39220 [Dictyobacter alpinus]
MYSGELTKTPPQRGLPRHIGLIIGMNQYQDSTFRPLQSAENDARALAQWLVNNKGGKWSPPDVQLVQGQHATRELIESLITQICLHKAEEGDSILLYFAGHAFVDERSGEGYLAFTNSRYQDPSTCLSLHSFSQHVLTQSRAAQILCIFDCFQTGPVWSMRRTSAYDSKPLLGNAVLGLLQSLPNRLFMCSCRGNEITGESSPQGIGQLMRSMIMGLSGPAVDEATGTATLSKLHAYLFGVLDEQHRPQLFGQQQTPFMILGDLPDVGPRGVTGAFPQMGQTNTLTNPTGPQTSGSLLKRGLPFGASASTATAVPPQAPAPSTSGHIMSSALDPHIDQQNQQVVAQAQQLFQAQNYGEAFNLIEQVLQGSPNDLPALILKGQLLGTAGRYVEAQQTIEHILQLEPDNAMGWSMQAVVLSNQGQHQQALNAIERSLELDAQNPETYVIKNNIMGSLAVVQTQTGEHTSSKLRAARSAGPAIKGSQAFMLGLALSILGTVLGFVGVGLLAFMASIPYIGLLLISMGIAVLCVNAARGSFRYGFIILLETAIFSILFAAILGGLGIVGQRFVISQINLRPSLFMPVITLGIWLAIAAGVPFVLALIGFLGGIPARMRNKKRS